MFLEFKSNPRFFALNPSASLEDIPITTGELFLRCAFTAIVTGVSVIPLAIFDKVLPVGLLIKKIKFKIKIYRWIKFRQIKSVYF